MTLSELKDKQIAIWGMGREGQASFKYLKDIYPNKTITVINIQPLDGFEGNPFIPEADFLDHLDELDVIIKSPGISYYHEYVAKILEKGITLTSATNLWFSIERKGKVIATTGSNGKSTTSALLYHILRKLDLNAELGGNIGTPLLSLPDDADYYVVELSSYQTCDLKYAPDIAVLLNLFPEHIQWHKSHENYYNDKCNLLRRGATINIVNYDEERTINIAPNTIFFNDRKAIHFIENSIFDNQAKIGDTDQFPLIGDHNLENLCAALTICKELKLNLPDCLEASNSYPGLAHRLQMLGEIGDHYYVNDSISTDPEATIAALKALCNKTVTLIAGGENREQNYDELCNLIDDQNINAVITTYETGPRIFNGINRAQKIAVKTLKEAVKTAQAVTPTGGYILLSPASPSYDAFKDFEERGDLFIKYAQS